MIWIFLAEICTLHYTSVWAERQSPQFTCLSMFRPLPCGHAIWIRTERTRSWSVNALGSPRRLEGVALWLDLRWAGNYGWMDSLLRWTYIQFSKFLRFWQKKALYTSFKHFNCKKNHLYTFPKLIHFHNKNEYLNR